MRIIVWGTGKKLMDNIEQMNMNDVCFFIDSNSDKYNQMICGKKICAPDILYNESFDYILISTPVYFEEISNKLLFSYEIEAKKIINWDYYWSLTEHEIRYNHTYLIEAIKNFCGQNEIERFLDIDGSIQQSFYWGKHLSIKVDSFCEENANEQITYMQYDKVWNDIDEVNMHYSLGTILNKVPNQECLQSLLELVDCILIPSNLVEKNIVGKEIYKNSTKLNIGGYLFLSLRKKRKHEIQVFQVTHKAFNPIGDSIYSVIHAGKVNGLSYGYQGDETGDNISTLNGKLNECTALYWMWKHANSKYIGLNHYRRLFQSQVNSSWMLQEMEIDLLLEHFDILVAEPVYFKTQTVREVLGEQVCSDAFQATFKVLDQIMDTRSDIDKQAYSYVMNGNMIYPCNMFITNKSIMDEYCTWLFPILFGLVERVQIKSEWDAYSKRIIGFCAERLFTIWLIQQSYSVKALPVLRLGDEGPFGLNN